MRIEYDVTPEDWAAFGEYHARTCPRFRRAIRMGVASGVVMALGVTALLWVNTRSMLWPVAWIGIRDVIQTPEHAFVMIDELQGYVIPKKLVRSGELASLVREIDRLRAI